MSKLIAWALARRENDGSVSAKRQMIAELNQALSTNYSEPHLNNWLSDRKPTPKRVWQHLCAELLKAETGNATMLIDILELEN